MMQIYRRWVQKTEGGIRKIISVMFLNILRTRFSGVHWHIILKYYSDVCEGGEGKKGRGELRERVKGSRKCVCHLIGSGKWA